MADEPALESDQKSAGASNARRIGAAAVLLGASAALSRVVGYAREVALANQLGVGARTDAYYAAFQIPDLLNYLLAGGALTIAFMPLYMRIRGERGEEAAERFFATVLGTLGVVTILATLALWLGADGLVALQFPRFDDDTHQLTVDLTRIVLPGQIFFVTGGILRAVLMARGRFISQALSPLLYNGCIIAGGLVTGTPQGFAWGVLVGAVVGPWLVPILDLTRTHRIRLRVAAFDPDFGRYLITAAPLMIGFTLVTVDEWYEKWFGAVLGAGTVSYLGFARRLMQVPVAVVGQAVAVAALPTLSGLHAAGRGHELDRTLLATLRAAVPIAVLAGAACWVFAVPGVSLLYRHGAFTSDDAVRVAAILQVLALAVPAWVAQQIGVRGFYAREDTWRPMLLGSVLALLSIPVYLRLGRSFGAEGLAAAGVLAMSVNAVATLVWLRSRYGGPAFRPLGSAVARAFAIAIPAIAAGRFAQGFGDDRLGVALDLAAGGAAFLAFAAAGIWVIGDDVMKGALRRLTSRLARGAR